MLVLLMMMCSRVSVMAISMGEMGGRSFSILWPLIIDLRHRSSFESKENFTSVIKLQRQQLVCFSIPIVGNPVIHVMKSAEKHFNQLLENEQILKFNEEALELKLNDTGLLENETTTMHRVNHQFTDTHVVVSILLNIDSLSRYHTGHTNTVSSQGIKVLWLPRQENEILSYQELQKQYPRLQAFEN
ncbi:hypothetical protein WN944_019364 [Citrus x changshan-huyou]|uniref:Uncharacterized protein n=1 Tax=Citrus x changshan-huyou TaxID=2935761 RepID=A0AAP0LVB4_9ROSI